MTTRAAIIAATASRLGLHPGGIADDQTLANLGADSLNTVEIAMQIEATLNLSDPINQDILETGTIAQIVAAVDAMRGQA